MERTRVLHIIGGLSTGGAEMMLYKLLAARRAHDLEHSVITLKDGGPLAKKIGELGVPVRSAGMSSTLSLPVATPRVLHLARGTRPHVVQGWMYHGNIVAYVAARFIAPRPPVNWAIRHCIYDLRDEKRGTARLIRLGARWSSRIANIIYNSRLSMDQHTAIGYSDDRGLVIPNGFDCDRFKPRSDARSKVRRELGIDDDVILIGIVARYHPMKDHATFFNAAKQLLAKHSGAHFLLAGANVVRHNPELTGLIASLGLQENVHLLGERSDIPDITASLDISTLSSTSEAFPNVVGEAMACGVPVVATDVGENAEIIGTTGVVVPAGDAGALARAWLDLVARDANSRRELGRRARDKICGDFAIQTIAHRYEMLYKDPSSTQ